MLTVKYSVNTISSIHNDSIFVSNFSDLLLVKHFKLLMNDLKSAFFPALPCLPSPYVWVGAATSTMTRFPQVNLRVFCVALKPPL